MVFDGWDITLIVLVTLSIGQHTFQQGEYRHPLYQKYNGWLQLLDNIIILFIVYMGGMFT